MAVLDQVSKAFTKVFGSRNDRLLKRYSEVADHVEGLEARIRDLSDEDLRGVSDALRDRLAQGESESDLMPEAFAVLREASRRAKAHRHFKCQLIGGQVLYEAKIAEMRTGEGKTIVCHLPAYMQVLRGNKVHIVTVNDYLVRRDAEFAQPIFELLGLSVGFIQANVDSGGSEGVRQKAYACNITYGTNSEFGFDYLRDNMKIRFDDQVQGSLDYVIIDEVDSILIDEARTPLIISGPAHDDITRYKWADNIARFLVNLQTKANSETTGRISAWGDDIPEHLKSNPKFDDAIKRFRVDPSMINEDEAEAIGHVQYYVVQRERKSAQITHQGVDAAQEEAKIGSFYVGQNMDRPHLIENALRARVVYERDKEYVVQNGEVIIVDEFTGRLMHGRQWSDGLHQAVEAKEAVRIKEESQTLATITIQNYFKLYEDLAGMTGTAITESAEFINIYNLEVVEIPTNRPINRIDHNDRVFASTQAKYDAIVEEIHEYHRFGRTSDPFIMEGVLKAARSVKALDGVVLGKIDKALAAFKAADDGDTTVAPLMLEAFDAVMHGIGRGRPVLVGTTSVEDSEKLSNLLSRRFGIEHEVLNAKQHAREADIVAKAGFTHTSQHGDRGTRGNVTIATNMAGRGTDIKLELAVVNEHCKVSSDDIASVLYPVGTTKCCIRCEEYDASTQCGHCFKPKLDPRFPELGRKVCALNPPCGLHIVGTERHESRRIDNQLRGRAGRQGDPGSSRFFLSLEDDLLKLFMPDWMLKMMAKMGFAGGMSLEDKRLSKGIERAQKKVEERNFSSRKNLLEWDEPPNYQRKVFYGDRQKILEGRGIQDLLWQMIDDSVKEAVDRFLDTAYPSTCIADWCRTKYEFQVDAEKIRGDDSVALSEVLRRTALSEGRDSIQTSMGEYVDPDTPRESWDINGLQRWAERAFSASLTQNQLRRMEAGEIELWLVESAEKHCATLEFEGIDLFLDPDFGLHQLVEWARGKFNVVLEIDEIRGTPQEAEETILLKAREAYRLREVEYPVQYIERVVAGQGQTDNPFALQLLTDWANLKYQVGWTVESIQQRSPQDVFSELRRLNHSYLLEGKLEEEVDQAVASHTGDQLHAWVHKRFQTVPESAVEDSPGQLILKKMTAVVGQGYSMNGVPPEREDIIALGRRLLRYELTLLEQYVLLRIYDQAWKDHLLEMDHLKSAIQQRPIGGDQSHPQSQFAIEGRDLFNQMWNRIREHVTDRIFKVQLAGGDESTGSRPAGGAVQYQHADASGSAFSSAAASQDAAAMRPQNQAQKAETIRREEPKVKRNDPCPCGSGKKYKQCCGKT